MGKRDDPELERQQAVKATPRGEDPLTEWKLNTNDKRFLRSIRIDPNS